MHIVYLIDNLGSGGAQRQAVEIAIRLRRKSGVRMSFLIYRDVDFFRDRLREADVPVVLLPKLARFDPLLPGRIRRWLRREKGDVVHAFLLPPAMWTLVAIRRLPADERPPFVAAERSDPAAAGFLEDALNRWTYSRCDALTVNSQPGAEYIRRCFDMKPEQVHHIPNGIDLVDWDRAARKAPPLELERGRFHLALVGRFVPEKDHPLLLDALGRLEPALVRELRVWFVGAETGGKAIVERIRRDIARRGLDDVVRLIPPIKDLPAVMGRLDALVLPSRFEGFPNVVLEAMASGIPVLASTVGDIPNMIRDGVDGFLFPSEDVDALAAGLKRLVEMPQAARAALGRQARLTVEQSYQIDSVAQQYLDLYRSLRASCASRGAM